MPDPTPPAAPADTGPPSEDQRLAEFLKERGIDLRDASRTLISHREGDEGDPEGDTGDDPSAGRVTAAAPPVTPPAPPAAPPPPPPAEEERPGSVGYLLRQERRRSAELEAYLNVFLEELTGKPAGGVAPAAAPPEEAPDLFLNPPAAIEHHVKRLLEPLAEEVKALKAENEKLRGSEEARGEEERVRTFVSGLSRLEAAYEHENPGSQERFRTFAESYQQHLVEQGWTPEEAREDWNREVSAMTDAAIARRRNPVAFVDGWIKRLTGGGPAAAAPAAPAAPRNGHIAAAERAQAAGATPALTAAAPTIEEVRRRGITPDQVREMLRGGDRSGFLRVMREAEKRS